MKHIIKRNELLAGLEVNLIIYFIKGDYFKEVKEYGYPFIRGGTSKLFK